MQCRCPLRAKVIGDGKFTGLFSTGFDNDKAGGVLGTIVDESKLIVDSIAVGSGTAA